MIKALERLFVIISIVLAGCASTIVGDTAVFQSFEFGTRGQGAIDQISINYGDVKIPTLHNPHFDANHRFFFSETMTVPVPATITIHWVTQDGSQHETTAPMRSFVRDKNNFYGFRFVFVDDQVEIFLLEKMKSSSAYIDVIRTKVFPAS